MNLTDIYITFHQTAAEYIFFLSTHVPFSRIHHFLVHEAIVSNFRRLESYAMTQWCETTIEINQYSSKTGKFTNMWKLNKQ